MTEYYHSLTTEKSFEILQDLKREFEFVLIGGWAVYLYTKSLKSKDIDIIVPYKELERIRNKFQVFKNDRLKKYEVKLKEADIDIYVPFYSELGISIELMRKETKNVEGFEAPLPHLLLISKLHTYSSRQGTIKGEKDAIDIFSLISKADINWGKFKKTVREQEMHKVILTLRGLIDSTTNVPELELTEHKMAKLKREVKKNIE